jgi:G6PDH family F420-dependent oxidoreductase
MLREALEIIRLLWQGGYQSYDGKHLQLEDARVFDLPETLPRMPVAAGGPQAGPARGRARRRAVRHRAAVRPRRGLHRRGGSGPLYCEAPLAWAPDEDTAAQALLETSRWALTGWKVMSELPNPVNFDAASATVRKEDVVQHFACGPDVARHLEVVQPFVDAGFDHVVLMNAGPDPDGFLDFFTRELAEPVRALTPDT